MKPEVAVEIVGNKLILGDVVIEDQYKQALGLVDPEKFITKLLNSDSITNSDQESEVFLNLAVDMLVNDHNFPVSDYLPLFGRVDSGELMEALEKAYPDFDGIWVYMTEDSSYYRLTKDPYFFSDDPLWPRKLDDPDELDLALKDIAESLEAEEAQDDLEVTEDLEECAQPVSLWPEDYDALTKEIEDLMAAQEGEWSLDEQEGIPPELEAYVQDVANEYEIEMSEVTDEDLNYYIEEQLGLKTAQRSLISGESLINTESAANIFYGSSEKRLGHMLGSEAKEAFKLLSPEQQRGFVEKYIAEGREFLSLTEESIGERAISKLQAAGVEEEYARQLIGAEVEGTKAFLDDRKSVERYAKEGEARSLMGTIFAQADQGYYDFNQVQAVYIEYLGEASKLTRANNMRDLIKNLGMEKALEEFCAGDECVVPPSNTADCIKPSSGP